MQARAAALTVPVQEQTAPANCMQVVLVRTCEQLAVHQRMLASDTGLSGPVAHASIAPTNLCVDVCPFGSAQFTTTSAPVCGKSASSLGSRETRDATLFRARSTFFLPPLFLLASSCGRARILKVLTELHCLLASVSKLCGVSSWVFYGSDQGFQSDSFLASPFKQQGWLQD